MTHPLAKEILPDLTEKQLLRTGTILKRILDRRQMTRAELSEGLGMSTSSVAKYVKALIDMGFVREVNRSADGVAGRSAVLELDPNGGLNVVVDVELNTIHGALVSLRGDIVATADEAAFYGIKTEELLARTRSVIRELVARASGQGTKIFGIGVSLGGAIDQRSGISYDYGYAADWRLVPVKEIIEGEFKLPCFVLRNTNAVAAGEKYFGFGVGIDTFFTVWIAQGVSLGAVIGGEVYLGSGGFLGEFGHIQAVEQGRLCFCGHTGCLETVTKESYILEKAVEGLKGGVHSEIRTLCGNDPAKLSIADLKTAANHGDRFCKLIFEEVAGYLGPKLSDIINVFNPSLVTFRGSVIDGNSFLFENIYRIVLNRCVRNISNSIQLRFADADNEIRLKGLGSWILMNYFVGR